MKTRLLLLLALGVSLSSALTHAGGWAVTTITRLPDYVVVGQPVRLEFAVRQHGHTLISDLSAVVEARLGGTVAKAVAHPTPGQPGRYSADLVIPSSGNWTLVISHGFGPTAGISLPAVTSPSQAPRALAAAEQGFRLFAAKGCASCHADRALPLLGPSSYGPELTGRRYPVEFLAAKLAQPIPCAEGQPCMPVLGIRAEEIEPLAAFLNSTVERKVRSPASLAR
jgi:mono/diheme cytochrome c family protein